MLETRHNDPLVRMLTLAALTIICLAIPQLLFAASLDQLIAKAKQEQVLNAHVVSGIIGTTQAKLIAAFKKHFGLDDTKITITSLPGRQLYGKAFAETKIGGKPTYDVMEGSGKNNVQLVAVGGVQKIAGWESLLKEINSNVASGKVQPKQISPDPFSGFAFQYMFRVKGLAYNPRKISKEDLPKTHAELADPKYKDRWIQPPYAAHWDIGPLAFPDISNAEWIELVRKAGKNAGLVTPERAGIQRLAIGEYAFGLMNTYDVHRVKAKDSTAPLEITYFKDYNPVTGSYYIVRKGAQHPAAATLFALWMGTPEAKAIWQPDLFATQFPWGGTDLDRKVSDDLKKSGARTVSFFDSKKGVEFLAWIGTPEGRKFRKKVSQAIRGKK